MDSLFIRRRRALALLLAVVPAALAGCGGDPFPRHQVSGTVRYQGQPVERGMIVFEPKETGKLAPTCYVVIKGGVFRSSSEESPTTGLYQVRVLGLDMANMPAAPGEDDDGPPPLFPEYVLEVEMPPPGGRLDIEVPDGSGGRDSP